MDYEKLSRQREKEWRQRQERLRKDADARSQRLQKQAQEREERLRKAAEARDRRLQKQVQEREERYRRQAAEQQKRWEKQAADQDKRREEQQKRWEKEQAEREKEYQKLFDHRSGFAKEGKRRGFFGRLIHRTQEEPTRGPGDIPFDFGFTFNFEDILAGIRAQAQTTQRPEEESISPAEATRRSLMRSLPREKLNPLQSCDEANVRSFIATVYRAREVDSERSDWNIYVAYRRAIEVEVPEPAMVEKVQIAGILLEGFGKEAQFPF